MVVLIALFPLVVGAEESNWVRDIRPKLLIPYEESVGIVGSGTDVYRAGDLWVKRMVAGQVSYVTPWSAVPDIQGMTDWVPVGARIRTATAEWEAREVAGVSQWVNVAGDYVASAASVKVTQWMDGDHTIKDVTLEARAVRDSLEIACITSPDVSHEIDWLEGYHYSVVLDEFGYIAAVHPLVKWFWDCTFRFTYVKAD